MVIARPQAACGSNRSGCSPEMECWRSVAWRRWEVGEPLAMSPRKAVSHVCVYSAPSARLMA